MGCGCGLLPCPTGFDEFAHAHAKQAEAAGEVDAFEAEAGLLADEVCVGGGVVDGGVAGGFLEVVKGDFDADGAPGVAFALEVGSELLAQPGEDGARLGPVAHGV